MRIDDASINGRLWLCHLGFLLGLVTMLSPGSARGAAFEGKIADLWLHNFGIVVENATYTIYRSAALGREGLTDVMYYLEDHGHALPRTIIHLDAQGYTNRDGHAIEEFLAKESLGYDFYHSFAPAELRTYIDGSDPGDIKSLQDVDRAENIGARAHEYFPYQYPQQADGGIEAVKRVLEVILDPAKQPVLFHCSSGKHRTGMLALVLRYLQGGPWLDGPKKKYLGKELNPAQYEYTRYNKSLVRQKNFNFVDSFAQTKHFKSLKEKYQRSLVEKH